MTYFQVPVLGFLFVSFRSTLIHSHSCFSGDSLVLSLSGLSASSSLSFVRVLFASSYLAFCFFRSLLLGFASQRLFQCFGSSFRLYRFPHSLLPDFSCIPSWFWYLAFCLFPFILPCFAPTAVPQVFPFDCSLGLVLDFRFSTWLLSFLLFLFPSSWSPLAAVLSVLVFLFRFWYSAYCNSFLRFVVSSHSDYLNVSAFSFRTLAFSPWLSL